MVWYFLLSVWGGQTLKRATDRILERGPVFLRLFPPFLFFMSCADNLFERNSVKKTKWWTEISCSQLNTWTKESVPSGQSLYTARTASHLASIERDWVAPLPSYVWRLSPHGAGAHTFSPCFSLLLLLTGSEHFPAHMAPAHTSC